jgi:hypothetical protein
MATRYSTGQSPAFLLSKPVSSIPIRPTVIRGQLVYVIGDVAFTSFRLAASAWSAAEAHRLDIAEPIDDLIGQRTVALAEMRRAGDDLAAFSIASKCEARLAAQIRQLCRQGGAR